MREDGFTLVELMVAVSILAIITATLGSAFVITFRTADQTTQRLGSAHDVQLTSSAFALDVQSAEAVWVDDPAPLCGPSSALLYLRWMDGAVLKSATYAVTSAAGERRLVRHRCASGSASTSQVVAHFVESVDAPRCDASACTGTVVLPERPREVAVAVTSADGSSYSLRGTRRTQP